MLKNQDTVPELQTTPGAPRVTPEELTQALAAIEARKQAEAARLAGTIPIDQAISDLHLDTTSDEIWAEVQAQRAKASAAVPRVQPRVQAIHPQAVTVEPQKSKSRFGWMGMLSPILVGWVLIQAGIIPQFWGPSRHISNAAPNLHPLVQVPVGQEVYADSTALDQIAAGKPANQITVSENDTGNRWPVVKMGDHIYLHGHTSNVDSMSTLQGRAVNIYNDDNSGELHGTSTSNITLRVDHVSVLKSGGDSDYLEVTVPDFQPDSLTTLNEGR